jgi:hypothetical protein
MHSTIAQRTHALAAPLGKRNQLLQGAAAPSRPPRRSICAIGTLTARARRKAAR